MTERRESQDHGPVTYQQMKALFKEISERTYEPHRCLVHPKGGVCLGCGQPWRLENGQMVPVVPDFGRHSAGGES